MPRFPQPASANTLLGAAGTPFLQAIKDQTDSIFGKGIVIAVQTEDASEGQGAKVRVYGSVNLVPIENIQSSRPQGEAGEWYKPLLPIHMLLLPELGEEVMTLIMNENEKFYFGRSNTTNRVNRAIFGHAMPGSSKMQGIPFDPASVGRVVYNDKVSIPKPTTQPGDNISLGRAGTVIKHGVDLNTKGGMLHLHTRIVSRGALLDKAAVQIILAENSNMDQMMGISNTTALGSYGIMKASNIRLFSEENKGMIEPTLLGKSSNVWLQSLVSKLDQISTQIQNLVSLFSEHQHKTIVQPTNVGTNVDINDIRVETQASVTVRLPTSSQVVVNPKTGVGRAYGVAVGTINFLAKGTGTGKGIGAGEVTGLSEGNTSNPTDEYFSRAAKLSSDLNKLVGQLNDHVSSLSENLSKNVQVS